jgi:hypothetical protein
VHDANRTLHGASVLVDFLEVHVQGLQHPGPAVPDVAAPKRGDQLAVVIGDREPGQCRSQHLRGNVSHATAGALDRIDLRGL